MSFGAPNPQQGFVLGTAAQPTGGATTGFTFGAGAGDANKAATPGLPQTAAQGQAKTSFGQPFGTSFAKPATGTPVFGATSMGTPGFGSPGLGSTSFGLSQPKNTPPSTNAPLSTGLTFGTPIGTPQAVTSQPLQMGFQQSGGLGFSLSTQSATPGSTLAPNQTSLAVTSQPLQMGFQQSGGLGLALPTSSAPAATSALNFNLGGTPASSGAPTTGGISFGAPKTNVAGTPATSGGGLANLSFGTPGAAGNQTVTSSTGFNITGATQQTVPSSGAPAPAQSAAGGFNLSGTQVQAVPASGTSFSLGGTTTPAQPSAGFTLGTPASSATFSLASNAPTTAAPAFSLGGTTSASSTPGFSLGKSVAPVAATVAQTSAPQTSLGTSTSVTSSTIAASQPAGLNFCQLEESINKWTLELEEQEKAFVNQATQVNAWDRLLIANGEKIVTLNQEVERVKLEQQQLEHELDYVVGQQRELQDCLVPLEKELASVSASDPEREYTYRLSENLDTQLKQMSEDLKEIIEHLNEANRSQDSSDPIVQIGKILNAHMNSLQWLDQRTAVLQTKIGQIDQLHQNFRQEHERSFNLAYN